MLLGVHVSISGHIYESILRADALGCNVMQIFSRDPRQWRTSKLKKQDIEQFRVLKEQKGILEVFVHVPYLINLASPDNILYNSSVRAAIEDIKESDALGAGYLVVHMGSHKKTGESKGLKRIAHALNRIIDKTAKSKVAILLENTSGSGSWLGYKFCHQRFVIDRVQDKARVGICLDTCHAYSAGYDLSTAEGYNKTVEEIENTVGLERLKLVHLNDTRDKLASKRDRHEHIGKGRIGLEGFKRLLKDPRFGRMAFVLETPKDTESADKTNLKTVRRLSR